MTFRLDRRAFVVTTTKDDERHNRALTQIRPTLENAGRLLEALADFGFPDVPLTPAPKIEPARLVEMRVAPVQIRVMHQIDAVSWDEVWATHERGPFGTEHVAFIGRAAFLRNKRAAGRPKDLADIHALREPE